MKFFPILLIFCSTTSFGQSDTSLIHKTFEYLKTDDFRAQLKNIISKEISAEIPIIQNKKTEKRFRKLKNGYLNFWLNSACLVPDSVYYIPNGPSSPAYLKDSFVFGSCDTIPFSNSIVSCEPRDTVDFFLISPDIIQLRHFVGTIHRNTRFGESNIIRLKFSGNRVEVLKHDFIFHN